MDAIFGEINGAVIMAMVIGIVQLVKRAGATGGQLTIASAVVGSVLVGLFQLSLQYPDYKPLVDVVVYGLLGGLAATGVFDAGQSALDYSIEMFHALNIRAKDN